MSDASPFKHDVADESVGFLMWKINALWQKKISDVLESHGLTQTQFAIMASLRWFEQQREQPTQAHLVEHARIEKMTISKAVRKLEGMGHVLRQASSSDGRAIEILLSDSGRDVAGRAIKDVERADDAFFAGLGHADIAAYKRIAQTIIQSN